MRDLFGHDGIILPCHHAKQGTPKTNPAFPSPTMLWNENAPYRPATDISCMKMALNPAENEFPGGEAEFAKQPSYKIKKHDDTVSARCVSAKLHVVCKFLVTTMTW